MKILFVYPEIRQDIPHFSGFYAEGIAILSAVLKEAGHDVELFHITHRISDEKFLSELNGRKYDLLAFSSLSPLFSEVERLAKLAKARRAKDVPVVYGGVHPTVNPERSIAVDGIDMICIGEGEDAFVELCDHLEKGKDHTRIRNLWIKHNGKRIKNPVRPLIEDLDTLPIPDIRIFDFENLFSTKENVAMMTASRGCPFQCSYCSNKNVRSIYPNRKNYVRFKSVDRTIKEALGRFHLFPHLDLKYLDFSDDILTLDKKWFREFAERYPREVAKPFHCNGFVSLLDNESICLLKKAGCSILVFGLESGSERIRKDILQRPRMTNEKILEISRSLHDEDVKIGTYNMVGLPMETVEDILDTIKMNAKILPTKINLCFFQPYPGTELAKKCMEKGIYNEEIDLFNNWRAGSVLHQSQITSAQLMFLYQYFKILVTLYKWVYKHGSLFFLERVIDSTIKKLITRSPVSMKFLSCFYNRAFYGAKLFYVQVGRRIYNRRRKEFEPGENALKEFQGDSTKFFRRTSRLFMLASRHGASFWRHLSFKKMLNLVTIEYQRIRQTPHVKGYPYEIIIDPTNMCNLRCPLCPTGQRTNTRPFGRLALGDFVRILDEVAPYLFKVRLYSWGEPLLHKDIFDMISYVRKKNVGTELSTNFQTFSEEDAKRMIRSGLEDLIISLDGTTQESYERYRVGGDLQKILDHIQRLQRIKRELHSRYPLTELQFLLTRHNEGEVGEIRRLARDLEVDRFRIIKLIINVKDEEQRKQWLPKNPKYSRYDYVTLEDKIFSSQKGCPWLWRSAVINWDGTVSPCCILEGEKTDMGNALQDGFKTVWNNDRYVASRLSVKNPNSIHPPEIRTVCTSCKGYPKTKDKKQQGLY